MLIVFPLGLLATSVAFDVVGLIRGETSWFIISFWMVAPGIMGGLLSAVFGLIDWLAIPADTRAKTVGLWHGAGNLVVMLLFISSWLLRRPVPQNPDGMALTLSFLGVLLALVTGWLGGELVDRLGVGWIAVRTLTLRVHSSDSLLIPEAVEISEELRKPTVLVDRLDRVWQYP